MRSTATYEFVRDERGQAIVESVIVVPFVLFVFIAMVQFILYANIAQLGNFAAYSAARSMSVHLSTGQGTAVNFAKLAGGVAYAPLSQPAPGEIAHYIAGPIGSEVLNIANFLKNQMGLSTEAIEKFAGIQTLGPEGLEGPPPEYPNINDQDPEELRGMYALYTALGRLKFVEGQALNFAVRNIGGPELQEVKVELHYEYPMYIPGFTELWNYLPGETTDEAVDVTPLHQALGGVFTVVVQTKASMGIESWSGVVITEDGREAEAPPPSGETGSAIAETAQQMQEIGNQIEQKAAEIKQLEEEKEQLEQELADCLNDADNEVEELACNAEFVPQINAKQNAIDALGEEIEDLNDDMQDLQEQATGEATEAVEQGIENLTAALNCE